MSVSTEKKRDNNLDLLRILSMLLIIFLHSVETGGVFGVAEAGSGWISLYVLFSFALTHVCVNCYVLISGYYLITAKFRFQKLIALWAETVFYSFVLKAVFMLAGEIPFSFVSLASCFFPILTGRYWFLTIYVGLYAVSPFLNMAIRAMNKRQHTCLNLLLFGLFSVWISLYPSMGGMNSGGEWGLPWFIVLYFCAAWFRLYYIPGKYPLRKFATYGAIGFLMASARWVSRYLGVGILEQIAKNWYRYDSVPVYLMSISLFVAFLGISVCGEGVSRLIRVVTPATFSVYLIHHHANVHPWLWKTLDLPGYLDSVWFPLIQLASVLAIFVICICIDLLRSKLFVCLKIWKMEQKLGDLMDKAVFLIVKRLPE